MKLEQMEKYGIDSLADEIKRMFDGNDYCISDERSVKHALSQAHKLVEILKEMKKND